MSRLDPVLIRQALGEETRAQLDELETFGSIASTNTYLISQPSPAVERFRVAVADHQTSGRGRHFRRWVSPPGAGLYMSIAYTFEDQLEQMPSLTLAIGVGVISALESLGVRGISLKWPNDVVAMDGKLGGILTELQSRPIESDWAARTVDLSNICDAMPDRTRIAAAVLDQQHRVMRKFAAYGFAGFAEHWAKYDWLHEREVIVDQSDKQILGIAAGVDKDGALLVDTDGVTTRVVSGSVMVAGLAA
jgi:BirA family biotin operon repressor/biotin-[acetyl-CoA-carboxylase] ligase